LFFVACAVVDLQSPFPRLALHGLPLTAPPGNCSAATVIFFFRFENPRRYSPLIFIILRLKVVLAKRRSPVNSQPGRMLRRYLAFRTFCSPPRACFVFDKFTKPQKTCIFSRSALGCYLFQTKCVVLRFSSFPDQFPSEREQCAEHSFFRYSASSA